MTNTKSSRVYPIITNPIGVKVNMTLRRMVSIKSTTFFKRTGQPVPCHFYSSKPKDVDFVTLHPSGKPHVVNTPVTAASDDDLDDDEEEEDMVAIGPSGAEYGGPTRGGKLKEPTRFGDWERKGRCSDF